jgi:hypothetical protein
MTPGFEIALAIGLIVGFALGYGVRALISYRRHQAARRRHLFEPRDVGGVNRANGGAAGYMTISPGEEAEARGREPSENRLSYLAEVPAPSMTCAHRPGSANLTNA